MKETRRFEDLGSANFGWLQAKHHFSFGNYYDPERVHFGILRVVNDDRVAAGSGFDPHPHENMEIITYVREGEIRHKDNLGNQGATKAGDVQVMSAGTGVAHAEYASETERTVLYQIWLFPREKGVAPRWDAAAFDKTPVKDKLRLLVSGHENDVKNGALMIHADARLWGGRLNTGTTLTQDFGPRVYLLISAGEVKIGEDTFRAGDALALTDEGPVTIEALQESEVVVLELPR